MSDKNLTEKELFERYKKEAKEQIARLSGLQKNMLESFVVPLFDEYERRYLTGPVKPEDERAADFLGDIHRKAKAGDLPPPEKLDQMIQDILAGKMNVAAMVNGRGPMIFTQPKKQPKMSKTQKEELLKQVQFDLKPRDIVVYLDKSIIGQREAKQTLARAVFYHYNAIRQELKGTPIVGYQKNNVVLIGEPGCGKTTLVRKVAELLNVPFLRFDATQFSPTGIVGKDATGIIREMVQSARPRELAEYGIVFVDEFDKLVKGYGVVGTDSYGRDIQATFLRILEDQEVDTAPEYSPLGMLGLGGEKVKTNYMLFIVAGAFDGLEEIVEKRLGYKTIGFGRPESRENQQKRKEALLQHTAHTDLVEYGFLSQLAGRIPILTTLHRLEPENLYQILTQAEGNILEQYRQQIKTATGCEIQFSDEALREIAQRAYDLKTGARGLMTVCESILKDLMFDLPQMSGKNTLSITKEALDHPKQMIFSDYVADFQNRYGIQLIFTDEAVEEILSQMPQDISKYLDQKFEALSAALRLIDQKTFTVTPDYLTNPTEFLQRLVQEKNPVSS